MNIRCIFKIYIFIIVSIAISSQLALAQGIKERMKQRLPAIAALKTQGIIGENNQGYLGFVTQARAQEDVITAENKDRKKVYTYFAKQQKTTLAVVEKIQAQRKAEKTDPGEFFQKSDGAWVKK
ncbi:MAG: YdbL family protein [Desulfobacula sp.]|nr:YdbL family protein [Desulfobacula sp.]